MDVKSYLLTLVMEECNEVAIRASKAKRFGINEVQPGQGLSNTARISEELDDLMGVLEELRARGIYDYQPDPAAIVKKREKIAKFMEYSRMVGCLTDRAPRESDQLADDPIR